MSHESLDGIEGEGRNPYPSTKWATILRAKDRGAAESRREALGELLSHYWRPVYSSVRYGWRIPTDEAQDMVQGFFLTLLSRDFLKNVLPEKGHFRSFLKKALRNYMLNEIRDTGRLKRCGRTRILSSDSLDEIHGPEDDPDRAFDQAWAEDLLTRAIEALKISLGSHGRGLYYRVLELHDLGEAKRSYHEIAQILGITETDVRNYLHYARRALRRIVLGEILKQTTRHDEIRDELRKILG